MSFLSRIFVITLLALGAAPVWAACQKQQASPTADDCKRKEDRPNKAYTQAREEAALNDQQKICDAHKDAPIPPEDLPTEQDRQELAKCDSGQLYAGVTAAPDYVKARKCAYLERESDMGWPQIGGAARLLQIYAQGRDVAQNMKLAVRFACEWGEGAAQMEFELLVDGLMGSDAEARRRNFEDAGYSVCDVATSGALSGVCAGEGLEHEKLRREVAILPIKAAWSKETVAEYENLYKAAERFFQGEAEFIVFQMCGSWCSGGNAFRAEEMEKMWPGFYETLQKGGGARPTNSSVYKKFDGELNAAYRQFIQKWTSRRGEYEWGSDPNMVDVTVSSIKNVQLAWIRYRDAFEKFGQSLTPPIYYKTYLTEERAKQLRQYVETYEVQ